MKLKGSKRGSFRIVPFKYRSGAPGFAVVGTKLDGTRVRTKFSDANFAEAHRQELVTEGLNIKLATVLRPTRLTDDELHEAEAAFRKLDGTGHRLLFAIETFLRTYRPATKDVTVEAAAKEFLAIKEKANRRNRTVKNLRSRIGILVEAHGTKLVSQISIPDIEAIVNRDEVSKKTGGSISAQTRLNDRLALSGFMRWCHKRGYSQSNPVADVETIKVDHEEPEIFTVDEVERFMDEALAFKGGIMLPYATLAIFGALRFGALSQLTWADVDLDQKIVRIRGGTNKKRSRRIVDLSDNAVEWLRIAKAKGIAIMPQNWRRNLDTLREKVGFTTRKRLERMKARAKKKGKEIDLSHFKFWEEDITRHTGLSYHFAHHGNENLTAQWGGTSAEVLHSRYKGLVTKKEATAFWDIRPKTSGDNIIQHPATAAVMPDANLKSA